MQKFQTQYKFMFAIIVLSDCDDSFTELVKIITFLEKAGLWYELAINSGYENGMLWT